MDSTSLIRSGIILLFAGISPFTLADPGDITTIAGSGTPGGSQLFEGDGGLATEAMINQPNGFTFDVSDESYYICTGNRVRRVNAAGIIQTVAGTGARGDEMEDPTFGDDGPATEAFLWNPQGVALDVDGNLFIADTFHNKIRRVDAITGIITTVCGTGVTGNTGDDGPASDAQISPVGLEFDPSGNGDLFFASGAVVRKIEAGANNTIEATDIVRLVAGTGTSGPGMDGVAPTASALGSAADIAIDGNGDIFIADVINHVIRKIDTSENLISTVAGDGSAGFAEGTGMNPEGRLNNPYSIVVDFSYNLYISDADNHRIRKIPSSDGILTTIAGTGDAGFSGDGETALLAELNRPLGIDLGRFGELFFSDAVNHRVRAIESVAAFFPIFRPDNLIGPRANRLRGNNHYTGVGRQKIVQQVRGRRAVVFYRLENDGNTDDRIRARVTRGSRRKFIPRWFAQGRNVTGLLQTFRYTTPTLGVGGQVTVVGRIQKRRAQDFRGATGYNFRCQSELDRSKSDVALTRLIIRGKRPRR